MGGVGSGRHVQLKANTTDDYLALDVRWLKREGVLDSGISRRITWKRGDMVAGSLDIRSEPGRVILAHRHRRHDGGESQTQCYPVQIDTTACHMGGERPWFLCPVQGCGRRVGILYGGPVFACRHCHRLTYPSQRERPWERAARRANRIRRKLGWPGGILVEEPWEKPQGMHWGTYVRLCEQYDELRGRAFAGIREHLDRTSDRF